VKLPVNQTSDTDPSTVEDSTAVLRLLSTWRIFSGWRIVDQGGSTTTVRS